MTVHADSKYDKPLSVAILAMLSGTLPPPRDDRIQFAGQLMQLLLVEIQQCVGGDGCIRPTRTPLLGALCVPGVQSLELTGDQHLLSRSLRLTLCRVVQEVCR